MIPEAMVIEIQGLTTRNEVWDALFTNYEKRALTVTVDLQRKMYALKCLDEGNVKAHMKALSTMYEQLKGMGEKIEDSDLMTLILV